MAGTDMIWPSKAFETLYKRQLYTTNVAAGVGDSRAVPITHRQMEPVKEDRCAT